VKTFTNDWLVRLNATHSGGVFFLAVELHVDTGDVRYYANTQRAIVFDGNTYQPVFLAISGLGQTSQQTLPAVQLTTTNVTGQLGQFLETTDVLGRDVILRILHLDLLNTVTNQDSIQLQILAAEWDEERATFALGLNIGLQELLPRHIITADFAPGVPEGLRRASIL